MFDGTSRIVEKTIADAYYSGVFLVASHGNQGTMTDEHFPASLPQVIAVAATDAVDLKPAFSNYGRVVSVSAPGDAIVSTYLYQGYAAWSGTSMAAPFVAGAGALAIERPPQPVSPRAPGRDRGELGPAGPQRSAVRRDDGRREDRSALPGRPLEPLLIAASPSPEPLLSARNTGPRLPIGMPKVVA